MILGYKNKKIVLYDKNFKEFLSFGKIYILIILMLVISVIFLLNISPVKTFNGNKEIQAELEKSEKELNLIINN